MSWNQWPVAPTQQPPVVATTPLLGAAPSVMPPGMPYTSDQWTQMQQQNWQQWAQWQQQYQQWHQQYGAEYQKSINALAAQQTVVPTMGGPPPLPLEPHPQPPLPKEEGPKPAPPLPVPVPPPQQPAMPSYTTQPPMHNQFSAPPPNFVATGAQQPWKGPANIDQKRPLQGSDDSLPKRQMTNRQGWPNPAPPTSNPNEELSEAEKKFDKQFAEWEAQFNKWKEQNSGHPDKQQYKEYEKKWEQWRQQLLDRREAMRRKRLGLPPAKSAPAQQFNVPPPSQTQSAQPPLPASTQPQAPSGASTQKEVQMFSKPPPDMNNEPLQFKGNDKEPEGQGEGLSFLNASKSDGIPGLDLVKDGDIDEIADDEPAQKGPDLEAISKGINNILGDQKLMSMLSMVSQNQGSNGNNLPKLGDVSLSREQSNLSGEDSRIDHPEPIQNFDDQTRSSFTMQPNESEYFRGNNNSQFGRGGGPPPTNFYDNEPPYSRPPPNFAMPSQDDLKRPPPRFGNDQPSFPQRNPGGLDRAPPTNQDRRAPLLPDPDKQPGFGQGEMARNSFGPGNMNKGRDSFGPGRNRDDFGPRGNLERGPDANWNGPGNMGREKMGPGGRPDFGEDDNGSFGGRPPFGRNFEGNNSFGNDYDDQDYGDEGEPFNDEQDFERDGRPPQNQRFGPGSREERENFNGPPPNFRGGRDNFNERPPPNFRGGRNDFNEPPPQNLRGGRDAGNVRPSPNFRGGRDDFNEPPPSNFRGGRDECNDRPPPNFRGGREDFNEPPQPNFRGGREDFNEPPQPNFRGGRNERPPPNFRGGRDDFNEPPQQNFRGGRDDFNGPPPPNFRGGRDDFNKPPPSNFNNSRKDFRQDDMPFQRDGDYGDAQDDRFDRYPDERPPPNRGRFNRGGDRFGEEFRDDYGPEGFEDDGEYPPPPLMDGFGPRDNMGPMDDAPEPPRFSGGQMEEGFEDMPPSDYVEDKPVEDLWKPVTVIDYEHKRVKPPEIDILVQPFRMFDYRHKFLRRIPYPDRPNWLSDSVKMIPEFDPPIIRPPPIDRRTFDDRFEPPPSRQMDRYRSEDRHQFERKPYDVRFSPPPPKYEENDWSSRRRRSRSPPPHRFERSPVEGVGLVKDRDNWDQGKIGDRDRRGGNKRWEEEERFRGDRNYDRDRRDRRDDRGRDEDTWRRRGPEWEDRDRKPRNDDIDLDKGDRDRNDTQFKMDARNNERDTINRKDGGSVFPFSKPIDGNKVNNVTPIKDILNAPGRSNRPQRIVIILRGPPGSGKTHLAKMIKDKEVENGGSAPRILSLDDYFMVEQEKEVMEDGKRVKLKEMVYEFEAEMEESYRNSLIRSFKKTITDGYFPFIIVDNVNDKVKYFGEMWSFAKQNGFQVYVCQLDLDIQNCTKRNVHNRSEEEIRRCIEGWETTPSHHPILDVTSLLQGEPISEVEMEEINSTGSDFEDKDDGTEDQLDRSKWDNFDCSINNLARLDGLSKPPRPSRTMEEYLQLDDEWEVTRPTKPGQKRVRWADLEERKQQEKMRAIGFVVGQTDWDRMMDPTMGQSALTQTKYIEKVQRRRF